MTDLVDRWYSAERDASWFFPSDRPRRDRRPLGVTDMVEVERDLAGRCGYHTPWASQVCGEKVPCPEHDQQTCSNKGCTNRVTHGCDHAGMVVCGYPVCDEHYNCGRHGG